MSENILLSRLIKDLREMCDKQAAKERGSTYRGESICYSDIEYILDEFELKLKEKMAIIDDYMAMVEAGKKHEMKREGVSDE